MTEIIPVYDTSTMSEMLQLFRYTAYTDWMSCINADISFLPPNILTLTLTLAAIGNDCSDGNNADTLLFGSKLTVTDHVEES